LAWHEGGHPFLDRIIHEIKKDLGIPTQTNLKGIVLIHDLDYLCTSDVFRFKPHCNSILKYLKAQNIRKTIGAIKFLLQQFLRGVFNPRFFFQVFEFKKWAALEEQHGFRSLFFVFAPDRKHTFEHDADYSLKSIDRDELTLLQTTLKKLVADNFEIGLHLSRSSGATPSEIKREKTSLGKVLGTPVIHIRNHWTWMDYRTWPRILEDENISFDLNTPGCWYTKGTSHPFYSRNGQTLVIPTVFTDDQVLKKKNLGMDPEAALSFLDEKLNHVRTYGGCPAISFHPAEDGDEQTDLTSKLHFYGEVLKHLKTMELKVLLPGQYAKMTTEILP